MGFREQHNTPPRSHHAPRRSTRMRDLARTYPELGAFTPDATLLEIKTRYGLNSLQDVREAGRRKAAGQAAAPKSADRNRRPQQASATSEAR